MLKRFLNSVLLRCPLGQAYVCSLPNVKGRGPSGRHVATRDLDQIVEWVARNDQAGRGCFFSTGTIAEGKPRRKENFRQICAVHADVDFKDVDCSPEEVREILQNLPRRPAWTVESGNGLHLYWPIDPTSDVDEVEAVIKDVCRAVGGDPAVAHVVALMRLPGSHNSKNGAWTEVRAVGAGTDGIEALATDDLRGWPQLIRRKDRPEAANPFLRLADQMQFKVPMDPQDRLASMRHKGEGDAGIHLTQLAVTASLLEAGWDTDEVVAEVLGATKKAVNDDASWNWAKEEEVIRTMCADWLRKHPKKKVSSRAAGGATAEVVSLDDRRLKKVAGKLKKGDVHAIIGAGILAQLEASGQKLMTTSEGVWLYRDGVWSSFRPDEWKAWVGRKTEDGCLALKQVCSNKISNETRGWIERCPELWKEDVPWDDHGRIATLSGLIDHQTLEVEELTADHWVTHRIEARFDLQAECPMWTKLLDDAGLDSRTQQILQETLGCALVDKKPRGLMRALVLVGGSNTGKTTILRVMARFLSDKPITTPIDAMENAHGTIDFLRRAPWLLDEAFEQSKWHVSSTVKALLSGDYVSVNVKNGPMISHMWRGAVFWGTNVPPQFKEVTRAMENRLIIIKCTRVFDPASPTGIAKTAMGRGYSSPSDLILAEEKDGLLRWAVDGLRRAWVRGYIDMTPEVVESLREMRLDANVAAGFFDECITFDPNLMISAPDLYAAFTAWWTENSERTAPSPKSLGRAIVGLADDRIVSTGLRFNLIRYRAGIGLNETGKDYWKAQFNSLAVRGGSADRISGSADEVNVTIPSTWDEDERICSMRNNHSRHAGQNG